MEIIVWVPEQLQENNYMVVPVMYLKKLLLKRQLTVKKYWLG